MTPRFRHYRDERYDQLQASILERYKYYNGVEGNSAEATNETGSYSVASRVVPDVEDINQDNTLNEQERYFEYEIALHSSISASVAAMTALMVCMRFSASWNTTDCALSNTSSVTSIASRPKRVHISLPMAVFLS